MHKLIDMATNQTLVKTNEQQQVEVLLLLGSSLLFEENQVIGFLPLKTYFDKKKDGHKKCPQD